MMFLNIVFIDVNSVGTYAVYEVYTLVSVRLKKITNEVLFYILKYYKILYS